MIASVTVLALSSALVGVGREPAWQLPNGTVFEGSVLDVFGAMALVGGKRGNTFLPIERMTDEELGRVADFTVAQPTGNQAWAGSRSKVAKAVLGRLDRQEGDTLVRFDPGERPEPKFYLVYFSASWCGPCQRFTPELVKAHQRYQERLPGVVEVIFVSNDTSAKEQAAYVRKAGMPWPLLRYSARGQARVIERWEGDGIPCLVAVTRNGDVMVHSYRGEDYLGPGHVLEATDQLVEMLDPHSSNTRRGLHRLAVLEHVRGAKTGDVPPKAYLIEPDGKRFGVIKVPPVRLSLLVNEHGRVTDLEIEEGAVSRDLEGLLRDDSAEWLFLPAVKAGKPHPVRVQVPFSRGGDA